MFENTYPVLFLFNFEKYLRKRLTSNRKNVAKPLIYIHYLGG